MAKLFIPGIIFIFSSLVANAQHTYSEITLHQLMQKKQQRNNDFVILDVRTRGEFHDTASMARHLNLGHIKGAINIPLQDLQQNPEAVKQLEEFKDKEIYVICSHSYRSRTISNLLLKNSFTKVTNVQGGMSEWFRNYDVMKPYASALYESNIPYRNISPSQVFTILSSKEPVLLVGFTNKPKTFFDSLVTNFYKYFPDIKEVTWFSTKDSLLLLEKAKAAAGRTIITFNTVGGGAAEAAEWLTQKNIPNVNYLIGNLAGFYEYMVNYQPATGLTTYFSPKSKIEFYTPLSLCGAMEKKKSIQLVDLRHDTLFAKTTNGTKLSYKNLKGAVNFSFYFSAAEFEKQFPDKSKQYVFLPHQGYVGSELADVLISKGYTIGWLIGGNERWEWYTNNVGEFRCKDYFVQ